MDKNIQGFNNFLNTRFPNITDIKHTFKICSKHGNNEYLVDSQMQTINFDKLTEWYEKPKPQSADSLSFSDDFLYLIEFKSGDPTTNEYKLDKLIENVVGKINDSDDTLTTMYSEAFADDTTRLKQNFCLVVDAKKIGLPVLVSTLASLSLSNNYSNDSKEKILFEKVQPDLKKGIKSPEHFSKIDIWYSTLFEQYLKAKYIRSSVGSFT